MARQVLENGVILPAEYSDDWYDDMTSNLSKLDDVIGSDADKLSAENVGAAALSNDYTDLDNKPALKPVATSGDYDDLTDLPTYGITRFCSSAITDNSSIAFSAISSTNKIKVGDFLLDTNGKLYQISSVDTSNETVSVTTPLTQLAVDSLVIHNTGNETIGGIKTFSDNISTKKIISNVAQLQINARSSTDSVAVIAGADASEGGGLWIYGKNSGIGSDCRLQIYNTTKSRYERIDLVGSQFLPTPSGEIDCGGTLNKWKSFNGLNPGCLSLPDFSNAIDISSYITVTGGSTTSNSYTPPNDGYISVNLGRSSGAIGLVISNGKIEACVRENTFPDNHRECGGFIPVQKNDTVVITSCLADSIIWAYFIPCQGNV